MILISEIKLKKYMTEKSFKKIVQKHPQIKFKKELIQKRQKLNSYKDKMKDMQARERVFMNSHGAPIVGLFKYEEDGNCAKSK